MTEGLVTTTGGTAVMDAVSTLRSHDVGRLLVLTEDGRFDGLLSRTDVVTALERIQSTGRPGRREPGHHPSEVL